MNKKIDVMLINPYDENALKNALGFINSSHESHVSGFITRERILLG